MCADVGWDMRMWIGSSPEPKPFERKTNFLAVCLCFCFYFVSSSSGGKMAKPYSPQPESQITAAK